MVKLMQGVLSKTCKGLELQMSLIYKSRIISSTYSNLVSLTCQINLLLVELCLTTRYLVVVMVNMS